MADKDFVEQRKAAKAREDAEVLKAQQARAEEIAPAGELNAFTKIPGSEFQVLPEDSPAAKDAQAFRKVQLGIVENTPEELVKVGLPHPDSQTFDESQVSDEQTTELVYTKDTEDLPEGAAGGIIADGVFEIVKGTVGSEPDAKSVPVNPKAKAAEERFGSHPVRLEDDTHQPL